MQKFKAETWKIPKPLEKFNRLNEITKKNNQVDGNNLRGALNLRF